MGKVCELCGQSATLRCEADDAELCWRCDAEVHGANYLVARHMRLVLCSCCSAETECQTSGPSPCPLSRSCAACNPAHVEEEEANVRGSDVLNECNDDSEELPFAVTWLSMGAAVNSCASQDSINDAHSSVEDGKAARKSFAESSRGRAKRMTGGGNRTAVPRKRSLVPAQSRKQQEPARKSRKKRGGSPVSVIPADNFCSDESLDTDIFFGVGLKA